MRGHGRWNTRLNNFKFTSCLRIGPDKRPAGQRFEDRITLFAAALEAASNGEKQTQTSPEDDP
jgi:hypothetical protein